jgi:hypothetical protein
MFLYTTIESLPTRITQYMMVRKVLFLFNVNILHNNIEQIIGLYIPHFQQCSFFFDKFYLNLNNNIL